MKIYKIEIHYLG